MNPHDKSSERRQKKKKGNKEKHRKVLKKESLSSSPHHLLRGNEEPSCILRRCGAFTPRAIGSRADAAPLEILALVPFHSLRF